MADDYKVPVTKILEIKEHSNATSLEFAVVYGFNVIVTKGRYKIGDSVLYIPIDSVITDKLNAKLFPEGSKVKLNRNRVRQIKIRSQYSQGMIVDLEDIEEFLPSGFSYDEEQNLAETLGITKYEPPAATFQTPGQKRDKPRENPLFHKYGGIDNFKWYADLFAEGEMVSVTEKIHGSNIRFGYVPYVANNLWRKILKFLGFAPAFEWVYGSNNVQLQQRFN